MTAVLVLVLVGGALLVTAVALPRLGLVIASVLGACGVAEILGAGEGRFAEIGRIAGWMMVAAAVVVAAIALVWRAEWRAQARDAASAPPVARVVDRADPSVREPSGTHPTGR